MRNAMSEGMRCSLVVTFLAVLAGGRGFAVGPEAAAHSAAAAFQAPLPPMRLPEGFGSDQTLIGILKRGETPAQRAAAAASLSAFVIHSYEARTALVDCLKDTDEEDSVRREAAKSLSLPSNDDRVPEALRYVAGYYRTSEDLACICLKAMYNSTHAETDTLLHVLDNGSPAQQSAAAWGLFKAVHRVHVRTPLVQVVERSNDVVLRGEALKSLFNQAHTVEIRDLYLKVAQRDREPALRAVAALGLISRVGEHAVRRDLEDIAAKDSDADVRLAAAKALTRYVDEYVASVFHLDMVPPNQWRNPILYE